MDHISLVIVGWHDGDGSGVVAAAICAATTSASAPVWFAIAASLAEEVASQAYGIVLRSGLDYLKIGRMMYIKVDGNIKCSWQAPFSTPGLLHGGVFLNWPKLEGVTVPRTNHFWMMFQIDGTTVKIQGLLSDTVVGPPFLMCS